MSVLLLFDKFSKFLKKFSGGFGKYLIFFPDEVHANVQQRLTGDKTETAISGCINNPVQGKGIAKALINHKGGVEEQIISSRNM